MPFVKSESEDVWHARRGLMVVVVALSILALIGIGVTAVFVVEQRDYTDCQREHNDRIEVAIRERASAGELDRQAIRLVAESGAQMIDVILPPPPGTPIPSQAERIAAIQKWQRDQRMAADKLRQAEEKRRENPLPEPRQC